MILWSTDLFSLSLDVRWTKHSPTQQGIAPAHLVEFTVTVTNVTQRLNVDAKVPGEEAKVALAAACETPHLMAKDS